MSAASSDVLWGWTTQARALLALLALAGALSLLALAPADRRSRGEKALDRDAPRLVVDPNTAPPQVLGALPKVGPALAGRIVEARSRAPFRSLDDVDERVRGIGPATIEALRPHLQIGRQAPQANPRVAVNPGVPPRGPGR